MDLVDHAKLQLSIRNHIDSTFYLVILKSMNEKSLALYLNKKNLLDQRKSYVQHTHSYIPIAFFLKLS